MHHLGAPRRSPERFDIARVAAHDLSASPCRRPPDRGRSRRPRSRNTTQSPRSNAPSTRVTPAGRRLLPENSARAAPASTRRAPRGSSDPAIHFLRAVTGLDGERNQVQGPPSTTRAERMIDPPVGDDHVRAACDGDFRRLDLGAHAAAREFEAAPPAIASISGVMRGTTGISLAAGSRCGGAV